MNKFKKVVSLTTAFLLATSMLAGCGKKVADDENTLEIYITEAGYGKVWLEKLETIFEAENPGIAVEITSDIGVELARSKVTSGPDINTADLIFSLEDWDTIVRSGKNAVSGYDYALADMTQFMEKEIEGVKLKDRFLPYYAEGLATELAEFDYEPHYFALPWATAATGIVYNANLFEQKGWALPRTSNELVSLAKTIKSENYIPFCNETSTGYMSYIVAAMWAQYDGADYYYDYITPVSEDDWYEYSINPSSNGRLYAQKVAEELFSKDAGLLSETAQEDDYGRAQGRLISLQGAMAINGDWFDNEMSLAISQGNAEGNNYASGMMQTPVISAIVDKLDFWSQEYSLPYYEQIADPPVAPYVETFDAYLAAIVDYVDGKTTTMPTVTIGTKTYTATATDIATVREARGCHRSLGTGHTVVIPAYAKAKDAAFKFLELFYSDRGVEVFIQETKGSIPPVDYDVTKWSGYAKATKFQKDVMKLVSEGTPICFPSDTFYSLPQAVQGPYYEYSKSHTNYKTAEQVFNEQCWTKDEFIDFMRSVRLM